jgi:cytochrome c oxidase assembly protein subunit 15
LADWCEVPVPVWVVPIGQNALVKQFHLVMNHNYRLDYKEQFLEKRLKKAEKFTKLLDNLGFHELAEKVKNDPQLKYAHPYSKATAYTEWINRLFGVLTGVFSLLAFISAFQYRRTSRAQFLWTISGLFWVIFNGWLGSVVVDTNLVPGIVTAHYAAAYFAFGSFIAALPKLQPFVLRNSQYSLFLTGLILLIADIFLRYHHTGSY